MNSIVQIYLETNILIKQLKFLIFLKILFIFREGKGGRERGKETSMCGCLLCTPYWGPVPQPRHVPYTGS